MRLGIRKWLCCALAFYLTAPLLGCYLAVVVTMTTAWNDKNVFLAIASLIAFAFATAIFVAAIWVLRRLTRKGPS
jgi:hypothetical protein